ncbi:S9 family serine peptidase [Carnobacterium divergens]|uniref:Prolyl oligopeptidase family serine peptidase n=2 Tax=Carnobacterium divergens TaxID=2748 RepID=A0AAW8RE85_CARDV|nr:prolyl oligopeptidase family serine peptidase [Carnobacterium divergens]ANZ98927.1 S9 family serine peptidase [Carnobacterium divergens]KRN56847.1 putative lipase esterase (putative) [Carnobacterium divergens DSM 20623]MDO0874930.1 prolyl oligopeptidase family serine peptidase [Carnobacterium divergens]MDT1958555.1 prolyl oligopeptidase family serine peptidase [Carnobacterium divergens]MDT1974523.1 prolyl oligopeptidase family serine peptidase [Carnobacterium divergens]
MKISVRHRFIKKIPVLEVVPEESKRLPLPLVIYYHGWQSSKELTLTQARKLAMKGIRVILPDAMNHGERKTGPISPIPSITFWSSIQYNLVEFSQLTHFFRKQGLIMNEEIGVGGVSMGGITTCGLLTQHPEIKVAASMMGTPAPMDYLALVSKVAKERSIFVPADLPFLLSWIHYYDLSKNPEKLNNRPVLFWHGTEDEKIPYQEVADFYQRIKAEPYAENTQFITAENERHLIRGEVMDQVANFFADHLI